MSQYKSQKKVVSYVPTSNLTLKLILKKVSFMDVSMDEDSVQNFFSNKTWKGRFGLSLVEITFKYSQNSIFGELLKLMKNMLALMERKSTITFYEKTNDFSTPAE